MKKQEGGAYAPAEAELNGGGLKVGVAPAGDNEQMYKVKDSPGRRTRPFRFSALM